MNAEAVIIISCVVLILVGYIATRRPAGDYLPEIAELETVRVPEAECAGSYCGQRVRDLAAYCPVCGCEVPLAEVGPNGNHLVDAGGCGAYVLPILARIPNHAMHLDS